MAAPFVIFLAGALVLLPFFFLAATSYDRLVRRLSEQHPEEWNRLGAPRGFFWSPPNGFNPSSGVAFIRSSLSWPFRLPAVLGSDPEVRRLHARLRLGVIVWNCGFLALLAYLGIRYRFPFL
jgi:hypothetical protein